MYRGRIFSDVISPYIFPISPPGYCKPAWRDVLSAPVSFLTIFVRPVISKSTGPILPNFQGWGRNAAVGDRSETSGRCHGNQFLLILSTELISVSPSGGATSRVRPANQLIGSSVSSESVTFYRILRHWPYVTGFQLCE